MFKRNSLAGSDSVKSTQVRVSGLNAEAIVVWAVPAFALGVYALYKGQDVNWDQLNYHVYSVYALFHQRIRYDIIPSQLQTWTNPFGNIVQYALIMNVRPAVATVALAVLASVSVPLTYFLAGATLDRDARSVRWLRILVSGLAATGAFFSPLFLSEVGATFNDYIGDSFGVVTAIPLAETYFQTGLVPRLPTAVLDVGMVMVGVLSVLAGLILDMVTTMRREAKRLAYLAVPLPSAHGSMAAR